MSTESFAHQIHQQYPEGLTGIFAIGGTRTNYILEKNRNKSNPGEITDFADYSQYVHRQYWQLIKRFFDLGGQNIIIPTITFREFYDRGEQYANYALSELLRLIDKNSVEFYTQNNIDPYFLGIDTMQHFPNESLGFDVYQQFLQFQKNWQYTNNKHKVIWEISIVPLDSLWKSFIKMTLEEIIDFQQLIKNENNIKNVHKFLHHKFLQLIVGTEIPIPHFYIGTNKSGDLKFASSISLILMSGLSIRLYYTPYPTLFLTQQSLQEILRDLAFGDRFHSNKTDYDGQYTPELAQAEYERIIKLSQDPTSILGFPRKVK